MHSDDFFEDIFAFNLILYVETPDSSGIDRSYLSSPLVTLGHYEGLQTDADAPEWVRMTPGRPLQFRQPRGAMAEVMGTVALWIENTRIVGNVHQISCHDILSHF
jgi:hypothetical protein